MKILWKTITVLLIRDPRSTEFKERRERGILLTVISCDIKTREYLYRYTENIYCEELYPRVIRDRPRVLYIGDPDLEHRSDSCISDLR